MIYTVTFNPSLDYIVSVDDFMLGRVNRTRTEIIYPGGKGINVSMVRKIWGMIVTHLASWQDLPDRRSSDSWMNGAYSQISSG